MAHPSLVTAWPTGADLRKWLSENAVSAQVDVDLIDEVMADASAKVYESIDPNKLPEATEEADDDCPRTVARAIILEAARLLYRRQTPHGVAAFSEVAVRLRTVDADVESLLAPWGLDAEP